MTDGRALLIGIDDYSLLGKRFRLHACRRDVELMRGLLETRGFAVKTLVDAQATRQAIVDGLRALLHTTGSTDTVVLYFSGHGSRRKLARPGGYEETIVPVDSGRPLPSNHSVENRDITKRDLRRWLRLITPRVAHVALIFDCCHSGSLVRSGMAARCRQVPWETRLHGPTPVDWRAPPGSRLGPVNGEIYTMLAACRPFELAFEMEPEGHGAFTFFLARFLEKSADTTYRALFQQLSAGVTGRFPTQHPIGEGSLDRLPLGASVATPRASVEVRRTPNGQILVGVGRIHGAAPGWRLRVLPPASRKRIPPPSLELTQVDSTSSLAQQLPTPSPHRIGDRCFAVLDSYGTENRRLDVAISALVESIVGDALSKRISQSSLLNVNVSENETAHLGIDIVPVVRAPGDCSRFLAIFTSDGEMASPPVPWLEGQSRKTEELLGTLVSYLEIMARRRNVLELEKPGPCPLQSQVDLDLFLRNDGRWLPLVDGIVAQAGDRIGVKVVNRSQRELFPTLLDFGLSGRISVLFPPTGAYAPIPPASRLELGMAPEEPPILLRVPRSLPFEASLGLEAYCRTRIESIKLFMSRRQADFSFLRQRGHRSHEDPPTFSSLEYLTWLAFTGNQPHRLVRCQSAGELEDWMSLRRSLEVRISQAPEFDHRPANRSPDAPTSGAPWLWR